MNIDDMRSSIVFALNTGKTQEEELRMLRTTFWYYGLRVSVTPAEDVYNGEHEFSYIVPMHWDVWTTLKPILVLHNQESVLLVNRDAHCYLFFLKTDKREVLGRLVQVSCAEAHRSGAYTKVDDSYFTTKEDV